MHIQAPVESARLGTGGIEGIFRGGPALLGLGLGLGLRVRLRFRARARVQVRVTVRVRVRMQGAGEGEGEGESEGVDSPLVRARCQGEVPA